MTRLPLGLALLICSCSHPPSPPAQWFPLGIFGVEDPAAAEILREEGFNAFQTYTRAPTTLQAIAKEARRNRLRVLFHPHELLTSTISTHGFPLAAWYLQDEPDVAKTPPEELAAFEAKVKAWRPDVPTAFVVGQGKAAAAYAHIGDAIMVDWYPVPHRPLESAGEQVRMTAAAAKGKPVWAVLQAMDWRDYLKPKPGRPAIGRFPDILELRFMSYHAILEGARGLWYFTYHRPDGTNLSDAPELWFALTWVTRELATLRPVLEGGKEKAPPLKTLSPGMMAKAWRYRLRDYVIVANTTRGYLECPEELLDMHWIPLFEPRRYVRELLVEKGGKYHLRPYQVLVFQSRLF